MGTEVVLYSGRDQLRENQIVQPRRFTWEVSESPANIWTWTIGLFDIHDNPCVNSMITAYVSDAVEGTIAPTGLLSLSGAVNGKILYNIAPAISAFRTGSTGFLDIEIVLLSGTKYLTLAFPNGYIVSVNSAMAYTMPS